MKILPSHSKGILVGGSSATRNSERGAALAIALMMMILLSAIALGVLAVVQGEAKISSSDLKRTEACYASAAAMEIMTNNFSTLFAHTSRPTNAELHDIELNTPDELTTPVDPANVAYRFPDHTLVKNLAAIAAMGTNTTVTIPYGPFNGLIAGVTPYKLTITAESTMAQCKLTRDMNNYLIPLFQFGMFSDRDIELHPGPAFVFNGRVHANGNIYVNGNVKFLDKVTTASEFIYDKLRNGDVRAGATVSMRVGAIDVTINKGSMTNGPNITTATATPVGQRGYFPGSPDGTINTSWNTTSVAAAVAGQANKFGGQLLTRSTGAAQLKLPLQLDGNPTRELIKRMMPNDNADPLDPSALSESRYHSKAEIRILIDDEAPTLADGAGIPAGQGVTLSTWDPLPLPNLATSPTYAANGGGRALWQINDNNTGFANSYTTTTPIIQQQQNGVARQADTVRGVKPSKVKIITGAINNPIMITSNGHGFSNGNTVIISGVAGNTNANGSYVVAGATANTFTLTGRNTNATYTAGTGTMYKFADIPTSVNGTAIPTGAGITGRVLVEIVDVNGIAYDITPQILSMGMTEGEPNSIIQLQRPLWAAFTQGSRDASVAGGTNHLANILNNTRIGADGAISIVGAGVPTLTASGYLTGIANDAAGFRLDSAPSNSLLKMLTGTAGANWEFWNSIVPINVYNVREGHLQTSVGQDAVYERGITSIVEVNMRNLARWIDGVYDQNLLAGTNAISTNIAHQDGYIVYISDRRGDKVKSMTVANPGTSPQTFSTYNSTNGMVDNVDIYGPNGTMDPGEDVQNRGLATGANLTANGLKDITELPDPVALISAPPYAANTVRRAIAVAAWSNADAVTPTNHKYFRNAVRLFNGENLQVAGAAGRLSITHGITVATENMVYIWGSYNTTGVNQAPAAGTASLNSPLAASRYCPGTGAGAACATLIDTQVPASIVADAFFPLSKTWFDSNSAVNASDYTDRDADANQAAGSAGIQSGTAVRAGIIAGNNLGALLGTPDADNDDDSRLNGGMHNFPRFTENWLQGSRPWNFVGSFVPLYNSTQALGQWWYITNNNSIYGAPIRNWAFDTTFLQMDRLPPGTPMFQYISPTAYRQVL
ncbi:MAG: hypothetical protein ND895_14540 [Pyrinomonadaceae bacterium]|nr:hypothetical protein [Pyrinomonadaceae bacterium]